MIRLVKVEQTSAAFPSAWDAWDADDNYYYLRYRSGRGTVRMYPKDGGRDKLVAKFTYGGVLDSRMTLTGFVHLSGIKITDWGAVNDPFHRPEGRIRLALLRFIARVLLSEWTRADIRSSLQESAFQGRSQTWSRDNPYEDWLDRLADCFPAREED